MTQYIPNETKNLLIKKHSQVDFVSEAIEELEKFLYLRSLKPGKFISVTDEIDRLWHDLIIETESYFNICRKLPGQKYIHHKTISYKAHHPNDLSESIYFKSLVEELIEYLEIFGPFTNVSHKFWGLPKYLVESKKFTLVELNRIETWKKYVN